MKTVFVAVLGLVLLIEAAHAAQTVLVMRHCVRTTNNDAKGGASGFDNANNYTAKPWPAWPDNLGADLCLPRGVEIVQGTGAWLLANGNLPKPWTIIADNITRDITTSHALAQGLNFPASSIIVDHKPFVPSTNPDCQPASHSDLDAAVKANWKANPAPAYFDGLMSELQAATGVGVAPPLSQIPDYIHHGYFEGAAEIAQGQVERFLMQYGGGLQVGWGNVEGPGEVYDLLQLHAWARVVGVVVPLTQRYKGASITQQVAEALAETDDDGTVIFVGHDDQLWSLSATLNMTWNSPEFPILPTVPGSMLRFDRGKDESISVSYHYPLFQTADGDLNSVDVKFRANNSSVCTLSQLKALAASNVDAVCANPFTAG